MSRLLVLAAAAAVVAAVVFVTGWLIDREPAGPPKIVARIRSSFFGEVAIAVVLTLAEQLAGREPYWLTAHPNQIRLTRPGWLEVPR